MDSSESDVVVWTESEESHAWWCEVLCIEVATSRLARVAGDLQVTGDQPISLSNAVVQSAVGVPAPTCVPVCRTRDAA
uniref:hypothetical protein n=1 Tax=Rhodococcus erythropolis TaxID=1833 RepID=UPI001C0EB276|nr:hypothetical protein [Rhodococcus erythropolis]